LSTGEEWKRDRIGSARAGTNPTVLARLTRSYAVIGDTQFLPGYCVLLVDDPAVDRLTDLARLNYEILGNTDAYLHAHLFPRYDWESPEHVGKPVWLYDPGEFYGPEAALAPRHDALRARIAAELGRLGAAQGSTSPERMA